VADIPLPPSVPLGQPKPMPTTARRREWAAALRWAANLRGEPTRAPGAMLLGLANQIEAGYGLPWADTPEPSAAPTQPAQDAPAAAAPTPGGTQADLASGGDVQSEPAVPLASAPTGPAILGRALLANGGAHGAHVYNTHGRWGGNEAWWGWTRDEIEATWTDVREVLLVDPAVARVLEAVSRWRHICTAISPDIGQSDVDDAESDVWAAVDALGEPAGTPPADPPPAGGPGWDRETIAQLRDLLLADDGPLQLDRLTRRGAGEQLVALLADRDGLRRLADRPWGQADEWVAERNAVRAELAQVTADREALFRTHEWAAAQHERELATARAESQEWQLRLANANAELAQVTAAGRRLHEACERLTVERVELVADMDRLATARRHAEYRATDGPGWDRHTVEGLIARSCADATGEELDQLRALLDDVDQYEGWAERLAEHIPEEEGDDVATPGLVEQWMARQPVLREEIRRDAAADALDNLVGHIRQQAANCGADSHRRGLLRGAYAAERRVAEIRAGTRPVPGSPEPDGGGDGG
jgi:hypothetical protein